MTKRTLFIILLAFSIASALGQHGGARRQMASKTKPSDSKVTALKDLSAAVSRSIKQPSFSVTIESEIQNKKVTSLFERKWPNCYYMLDTHSDGLVKEAIEIARQRYQKKGEQWVKVRKDPYPLREQAENYFPLRFSSKRGDIFKIKKATAVFVGEEIVDGKSYKKYKYSISVSGFDTPDSGAAWVNQSNGLLERLEINNCGIFGFVRSHWTYDYEKQISIVAPDKFIERDWIN